MDDPSPNLITARRCPHCDAPADTGLIFCRDCGTALRPPLPLTQPHVQKDDDPSNPVDLATRILIVILKAIAGIAAIVAILCPLGSFTQIFLFVVSGAVALICYVTLTHLDAIDVEKYGNEGYWPKPFDWNAPSQTDTPAEDSTSRTEA